MATKQGDGVPARLPPPTLPHTQRAAACPGGQPQEKARAEAHASPCPPQRTLP